MRADRARGLTYRQISKRYALGLETVHYVTRDVPMMLLPAWHRARAPKEASAQPLAVVHRYMAPR